MSRTHDSGESCTSTAFDVIDGRPWNARLIRNNNLRQHCHKLARIFRPGNRTSGPLAPNFRRLLAAIAARSTLLTTVHPKAYPLMEVLIRMAAYAPRWLRDPECWMPDDAAASPWETTRSLANHLFARWPVPAVFHSAWHLRGELVHLERDWFCHLAAGGSLRRVQGMPPSVSARALHLAMEAPAHLTIRQAIRQGQLQALGASPELIREVIASRMVRDLSNDAVWSVLFAKITGDPDFDPADFGLVADTLSAVLECDGVSRAGTLLRAPLGEVIRYCTRFWTGLLESRPHTDIRRQGVRSELYIRYFRPLPVMPGVPTFHFTSHHAGDVVDWWITQLRHRPEFVEEGKAMRNCVATYWKKCRTEKSALFSLRSRPRSDGEKQPRREITIEVDLQSRRVIQIQGHWYRRYTPLHVPHLKAWAEKFRIRL